MAGDCYQPPAECRSPAGYLTENQDIGCTPIPQPSAQMCSLAKLTHLHYPLSLTTHDVSLCRYPRGTRTRETGLAWYKAPGRYFIRLGQARARTAGSECCSLSPESHCPTVYTIHIVKEQIGAQKNPGWFEPAGVSLLELPWKVRCSSLPETICGRLKSSVPHYSWRAHQYGQTPYARVSGTDVHRRRRYSWRVIANACERRLKT
mgnify:CR=1 FL=1